MTGMHVGEVYRADRTTGAWDAIVVGSGIGGLAAGALLAKAGKRVLVLERHYVAGGFTHVFRRPGFEWDVGFHYICGVQRGLVAAPAVRRSQRGAARRRRWTPSTTG